MESLIVVSIALLSLQSFATDVAGVCPRGATLKTVCTQNPSEGDSEFVKFIADTIVLCDKDSDVLVQLKAGDEISPWEEVRNSARVGGPNYDLGIAKLVIAGGAAPLRLEGQLYKHAKLVVEGD